MNNTHSAAGSFAYVQNVLSLQFGLIMPEAFTQISRLSALGRTITYKNRVRIHAVLQTLSVILAGVGMACIYINKNMNNRPHLKTFHSWFGLGTFIYAVFQSLGGFMIMYPDLRPKLAPGSYQMKVTRDNNHHFRLRGLRHSSVGVDP